MNDHVGQGKMWSRLREAITDGFSPASLDQILRDNDKLRPNISTGPDFASRVDSLIDVSRQEGWLIELCGVLAEARSGNQPVSSAILSVQKWLVEQRDRDRTESGVANPAIADVAPQARKQLRPRSMWVGPVPKQAAELKNSSLSPLAAKVFISYRREDSAGHAGRVHDRLVREFGSDLLFMDVDGIPLGVNFVKVLQEEVAKCSVLLAVIGHEWLNVRDDDGRRRLDNPDDFVRVEIAAALQRDIPVIPIMLEGTKVPKANQLPKDLQGLALRNGLGVRHASFHTDIDILIRSLKGRLTEANEKRVQSLTPGADKNIWMDDGAGDRDTTPNLRSAQETTRQSDVKGPLHQVANPAVSAEQRAVVTIAPALSKIPEEVTNFPDENEKSIRQVIAAEPSDPRRPSDGVQHIAPRADVRSRNMLFIIFAGIAIVVMGAASLMWPTTGPQDSTTTVKPATDTASAPKDSTTTVKPTTDTASVPRGTASDAMKSVTDLPDLRSLLPGSFGSTIKGRVETQRERDWKARSDELAAQAARIQSRLESRMKAAQPDVEKIQEDMRALKKIDEELSKLLNEAHEEAREAIKNIKP